MIALTTFVIHIRIYSLLEKGKCVNHYFHINNENDRQKKYENMLEHGCGLCGERLTTRQVSHTITHQEGDFRCLISGLGHKACDTALLKLIDTWDEAEFQEWLLNQNDLKQEN